MNSTFLLGSYKYLIFNFFDLFEQCFDFIPFVPNQSSVASTEQSCLLSHSSATFFFCLWLLKACLARQLKCTWWVLLSETHKYWFYAKGTSWCRNLLYFDTSTNTFDLQSVVLLNCQPFQIIFHPITSMQGFILHPIILTSLFSEKMLYQHFALCIDQYMTY